MPQNFVFTCGVFFAAVGGVLSLGADVLAIQWGGGVDSSWTVVLDPSRQQGFRFGGLALLALGLAVSAAAAWWATDTAEVYYARDGSEYLSSKSNGWAA